MSEQRLVVVTGATGSQGGAVARALLDAGHRVRAYVRNPDSAAAQELRAGEAELAAGGFDDPDALASALTGADLVYIMGTPWEEGASGEQRQVRSVLAAARAAEVGHIIYSSSANADRNTGIDWYDAKYELECDVRAGSEQNWTIVAPAVFMQIVRAEHALQGLRAGVLTMAISGDHELTWIDLCDLGAFVAHVVDDPTLWRGKRIDLASQTLSPVEVAAVLSEAIGSTIRFQQIPLHTLAQFNTDIAQMYEWFDRVGMSVDVAGLHARTPSIAWTSFADWAHAQDWSVLA